MSHRLVVGCMTGTSLDGLDVALVRIDGRGLAMRAAFVEGLSLPLADLAPPLRDLAEQRPATAGAIADLSRRLALLHAQAVTALLERRGLGPQSIALIAAHGQTVFHAPPLSWQLFSPAVLAQATGVRVVSDLRAADLARGGQGAPITPIADWVFFRASVPVAVVNLGGFCNITLLPEHASGPGAGEPTPAGVRGFDLCACNHALDAVARLCLDAPFDRDGRAALAGRVDAPMAAALGDLLDAQSRSGRSLGTGDELTAFLRRSCAGLSGPDACASACAAVGGRIGRAAAGAARVLLAGGGARNAALVRAIRQAAPGADVISTAEAPGAGVDPAYREAAHMAVLGALCDDNVPITLASTTGVTNPPVAGLFTR